MTSICCAVVAASGAMPLARPLIACIDSLPQFVSAPVSDQADVPDDADAVLWVFERVHLPDAVARIAALREKRPAAALLAACAAEQVPQLQPLLGAGIGDFLSLPSTAAEFAARLRRSVGLIEPLQTGHQRQSLDPRLRGMIGCSPAFLAQLARVPTIASCEAGVLILGETGTGKEVCAQSIHYLSPRAAHPCVAVNCGAIPVELIESELFGHVKGAYTTAHVSREGLVREAEGGTLFLDDIDCLPLAAQAKLLRFLQEREYRPVGANRVHRANVRVIAASNHRLAQMAARGEFRQDLFFRLNVLTLELPPLRERCEDIAALAQHFVNKYAKQFGRAVASLAPGALRRLLAHEWPGNVRELEHMVERAVLLAQGTVLTEADLGIDAVDASRSEATSFQDAKARVVQQFERHLIEQLLSAHDGNITRAAQAACKNRRAFFQLIRKHRIEPERFRTLPH